MGQPSEITSFGTRLLLGAVVLLSAAVCSQSGQVNMGDSGVPDSGGLPDAGMDAGPDAGRDAGTDAGADAGEDAGPDAGIPADGGLSDGGDAGMLTDAGPDGGSSFDAGPGNPCLPFTMPSADTLFASNKKVFAHYFYPFPLSIDNQPSATDYYERNYLTPDGESGKHRDAGGYLRARPLSVPVSSSSTWPLDNMEKEVRLAIADGITGFTIDILGPNQWDAGTQLQNLLLAAAAVDSRFKIIVMPDLAALGPDAGTVESIISSVASSPAAYHLPDGRLVVTSFDASIGSVAFWSGVLGDLADAGVPVAFVPTFLGDGIATSYGPLCYGFASWGTATPSAEDGELGQAAASHDGGQIYMAPVLSQQYRPKDWSYWEAMNSLAFRNGWHSAIDGGADWVQVVTWSDFSESGEIEPVTDATLAPNIGNGYYDLNAYYTSWFLTGQAPTITNDVLYYFYRREPTYAAAPAQYPPTTAVTAGGTPGTDNIELLAFLTAPGTLQITLNGQSYTQDAVAGLTSFVVPLQPGIPQFALLRDGGQVFAFPGGIDVVDAGGLDSGTLDLTYWSGSASAAGVCASTVP